MLGLSRAYGRSIIIFALRSIVYHLFSAVVAAREMHDHEKCNELWLMIHWARV